MSKVVLLSFIGMTFLALPALAEPDTSIDFKGVPFGTSEKEFLSKLGWQRGEFECSYTEGKGKLFADRLCFLTGIPAKPWSPRAATYGGMPANIMAKFIGDALQGILVTIRAEDFAVVRAGLIEKYGQPDSRDAESEGTWRRGQITLQLSKYAPNTTDTSMIHYETDASLAEVERRRDAAKTRATGDM